VTKPKRRFGSSTCRPASGAPRVATKGRLGWHRQLVLSDGRAGGRAVVGSPNQQFPDYPIWTLFVVGERRFDLDKAPPEWGKPTSNELPPLTVAEAEDALAAVIEFDAYGSEVGQACDNLFCCG